MSEGVGRGDTKRSIGGGKRTTCFQQKFHRAFAGSLLLTAMLCSASIVPAMAQTTGASSAPLAQSAQNQQFNIPPQSLIPALIKFTDVTGIQLFFDSTMARDLKSPGVTGAMPREEALRRLLAGTGLTYRFTNATTVTLERLPTTANGAMTLPPVRVEGQAGPPSTAVLDNLPPPYAGGQVATGGQLGMLGNRDVMDTPFNQTSYTQQLILDQQARTLADVLDNDPSVRLMDAGSSGQRDFAIRGFPSYSADIAFNGLYGIAPGGGATDYIERVEVLNGPSALLNGMPPQGSIGGSIDLIPKRAGDEPLTRFTESYASRGQFGEHFDVSRRFGPDNACGARFNGTFMNGETAIQNNKNQIGLAALGFDCHTERLRVSADFDYQSDDTDGATRYSFVDPGFAVPKAPAADKLFTPSWWFYNNTDTLGMVSGEYDLTSNLTAYAAVGAHDYEERALNGTSEITDPSGDYTATTRDISGYNKNMAAQVGVRGTADTGPVNHAFNVNGSYLDSTAGSAPLTFGTTISSNIYNPGVIPAQDIPSPSSPAKLSDTTLKSIGIGDTLSIFNKRIQLTLGVRRQQVDADNFDATTGAIASTYGKGAWSPAYALVIKPWENVSLYANYIQGLQQGAIIGTGFANAGEVLPPFISKQFEGGVKVDWGKLTTTVSVFQITQPQLVTVAASPLPSESLNGQQRNRGIEINTFGEVTTGVRLLGGVMFIDGRQTETQDGTDNGKTAVGVPDVQLNFGAEWDTPFVKGLTLTGRAIYTSSQYLDSGNTQTIPDWTRIDVGARYRMEAWGRPVTVRFDIQNLFNESYWGNVYSGEISLGAPRTFLFSTTVDF